MGDEREALRINSILDQQRKRKRYNRHTPQQIQQMEAFYKECPHPDEKQRKELSRQLGIEPIQVKFWFQNKRTQMKTQHEHKENTQLRTENERLRAENLRIREALSNASCPNCGVPTLKDLTFQENQLRMDNSSLTQYASKPVTSPTEAPSSSTPHLAAATRWRSTNNEAESEDYRAAVMEVASSAMEELVRIGDGTWNDQGCFIFQPFGNASDQ